jgi:hypothetical protein
MHRFRIPLDLLGLFSLLALVWIFLSIMPLPPNDLWWHMAAGRIMIAEGELITTNRWAYTLPADAPYVYQSWLSELIMYGAWRLGDVPLLSLLRTLTITLSYGLVVWHARRRAGPGPATLLALLLAILVGWSNWTLRPQTLALLPGASFAVLLGEYLTGRLRTRWLWALPLLMLLWVNMHGSFVIGAVLMALAWPALAHTAWRTGSSDPTHWQRLRNYTLVGFATLAALFVNPLGFGIIGYLRTMLTNSALQRWFVEWQPPRISFNPYETGFWFFALVLILAVTLARGRRRPSSTDLLWYCALAWLAFGGVRYALWFALLLLPLLAERLALLLPERPATPAQPLFSAVLVGALSMLILLTLPWFAPAQAFPNAAGLYADSGAQRWLLGSSTPVAASAWLAANPQPGRFWTDMSYSSYTIWALPAIQVFADLRVELFPEPIWRDYFAISAGNAQSLALLDQWQIDHLLLDKQFQPDLMALLAETPGWCQPFSAERAVVFVRCP